MEYRISELCDIRRGASPRPIKNFIVESHEDSFPWVKIADATKDSSRYISITKERVSKEGSLKSVEVVPGDLIISNSATPGLPKIMKTKAFIHDGWLLLRNFKNVRKEFLYYVLIQNREKLLQLSNGSVFNNLKTDIVKNFKVNIPSLKTQDVILRMITMIEDKLDLNKQIIENLEELSQTLFKRWFVDFEFPDENGNPYKSSGGEMVDSELGKIPKEWTVKPLNEFIDIIDNRGKTPPLVNEMRAHPIIDVKALSGDTRVIDYKKCLKFVSKETYDTWFRSGHPKKGDTLLSTVGSIGETKMFYHDIGTIAQNVVSLRSENSYFTYDLINNIKSSFLTFNIGSVQPSIKITHINKIKVVYPSKIVIENYEKMIKKFISNLYVRDLENQNLIQLRDTLLPKLMSGEIEIPDDIEVNEDELSI
ncbi:restriction endonuclease subunit S [Staphylococcus equorum]|uniref:restriction endonuclease subunit S n=1 Tax=Staphylococcus equorum TaxID=246432 RepID=UPI0025529BE1|nr:restriction endonuclease subunit S [Staphylococcus equorum]MDK9859681.1 restriction endonuclease subunit S [Staphylococcus equorum]